MMAAVAMTRREPLDELTLRRAQRGDERAWRALVERYQVAISALLWRLLAGRARHRVEDLMQETFVRVLRALPSFDPNGPASLSTWILTIATRLALSELRRRETLPESEAPELACHDTPATTIERRRLGEALARAVMQLPDGQRVVLVLREYHELEYSEIAELLELELGTVRSRLARAREAVRAELAAIAPELLP